MELLDQLNTNSFTIVLTTHDAGVSAHAEPNNRHQLDWICANGPVLVMARPAMRSSATGLRCPR